MDRRELRAALSRAGVADGYYRIEGVHEPVPTPTDFLFLRQASDGGGRPARTNAVRTRSSPGTRANRPPASISSACFSEERAEGEGMGPEGEHCNPYG